MEKIRKHFVSCQKKSNQASLTLFFKLELAHLNIYQILLFLNNISFVFCVCYYCGHF